MRNSGRRRRLLWTVMAVCTVGAADLLAASGPVAAADPLGSTPLVGVNTCNLSALSQPFAPWLDYAQYELAPGGDFESSTWTMAGGAKLVAGSEPYAVTGTLGASSLSLPQGSSARSPLTCVDVTDPSIRFLIAGTGSVAISVVSGSSVIPAGVVAASGGWAPTPVVLTNAAVLGAPSGGTTEMAVSFSGISGNPRVDDVFVDPWSRG